MRGVGAGRSAVYPEARLAARSGQRGTSEATTGPRGARSAPPNPDKRLAGDAFGLLVQVVNENVVAQTFGIGEEGATAVDSRDVVDEAHQAVAPFEHERVDAQAFARTAAHFEQRLLECA